MIRKLVSPPKTSLESPKVSMRRFVEESLKDMDVGDEFMFRVPSRSYIDAVIKRTQGWESLDKQYRISKKEYDTITCVVRTK